MLFKKITANNKVMYHIRLKMIFKYIILTLLFIKVINCKEKCKQIEALVTGNVENEGFHRYINCLLI